MHCSLKEHEFIAEGIVRVVRASKNGQHVVFVTFDTGVEGASDEVSLLPTKPVSSFSVSNAM